MTPPSRMLFSDSFIDKMRSQLFSIRHRYQRDPEYPGWTFKDANHVDQTMLRYDSEDGRHWLYRLQPSDIPGQALGVWPD